MKRYLPKTVWQAIFALLMLGGAYAAVIRIIYGLGGSTNLSDKFPWGIWVGFDVLCGVGLAAGGFTLAATVHIFNIKRYRPIVRPAILTAFLGYLLVIIALMFDLGKPYNVWHPLVMWNPHSVMFEVGWCVTLYTTVLSLEFAPAVFERLGWHTPLKWLHKVEVPLIIVGILLSTLHQSSLGTLYLIMPNKLYALWYSPLMPVFFFVSAISVGLAMTIFESWHSSRAFGREIELPLLQGMARVLAVLLSFYIMMRFLDLLQRDALRLLSIPRMETYLFGLEAALLLLPTMLLFRAHIRANPSALYACSVMVIFGFITNRLNVSLTGMEAGSGVHYIPKWTEIMVTVSIVAFGFFVFRMACKYLPIFEEQEAHPAGAAVFSHSMTGASDRP